jgi:hypothetical protein
MISVSRALRHLAGSPRQPKHGDQFGRRTAGGRRTMRCRTAAAGRMKLLDKHMLLDEWWLQLAKWRERLGQRLPRLWDTLAVLHRYIRIASGRGSTWCLVYGPPGRVVLLTTVIQVFFHHSPYVALCLALPRVTLWIDLHSHWLRLSGHRASHCQTPTCPPAQSLGAPRTSRGAVRRYPCAPNIWCIHSRPVGSTRSGRSWLREEAAR